MYRKHYRAAAAALDEARQGLLDGRVDGEQAIENIARELARMFKADNARFDFAKFYDACGVKH